MRLSIKTERLQIRTMQPEDLHDFHAYRSNPEVTEFQSFDVMDLDQAREFITRQQTKTFGKPEEWVQYSIEHQASGKIIGDCAIKLQHDVRIAEVGVTISHYHQRLGYAKEALLGIVDFLFSIDGFHRIVENVHARNEASIKMLESAGFVREGHFRYSFFEHGKWESEFQYAMLRSDWEART